MPKSVNKVILLGNVGKDPEVKFLPSGLPVANLTLATSDRFKDKAGRVAGPNRVAQPDRLPEGGGNHPRLREEGFEAICRGPDPDPVMGRPGIGSEEVPHRNHRQRCGVVVGPGRGRRWRRRECALEYRFLRSTGAGCTMRSLPVPKSRTTIFRSEVHQSLAQTAGLDVPRGRATFGSIKGWAKTGCGKSAGEKVPVRDENTASAAQSRVHFKAFAYDLNRLRKNSVTGHGKTYLRGETTNGRLMGSYLGQRMRLSSRKVAGT